MLYMVKHCLHVCPHHHLPGSRMEVLATLTPGDLQTWDTAHLFTAQNWYNLVFRLVIVLDCNTITPDNHRKIGQDVSSLELELKSRGSHISLL